MPKNPHNPKNRQVTDRALRYRANHAAPAGPRICHYCGSGRNVEVEHVDGFEENTEPENLTFACRSCNTRKGVVFRNAGMGRRTRQYNPTAAAAALAGARIASTAHTIAGAFEGWMRRHLAGGPSSRPTSAELLEARGAFARGARRNPEGGARNLAQWLDAVLSLKGQGNMSLPDAIAMVHATPHEKRSEFAQRIWSKRRARGSENEVPF